MDCSNVTEVFSFSTDSSKSVLFVKLSEDALQCLEQYERKEAYDESKPTIQFKGDKGIITIPGENGKVSYDFSLSLMDSNKSQGSFQCMEKSEEGELTSLGNIETKMQLLATDASFGYTKSKIEAVDKKQKTYGAKVIKTTTISQAASNPGYHSQEGPLVPRRRKPVPLLKKFLNRNLRRQINESVSSGVSETTPNHTKPTATVLLSQPPLSKLSKEDNKKHVLNDSCDNYEDKCVKKQRISHCSQKKSASDNGELSPTVLITNGTIPENVKPEKNSKQDNKKRNCIEQLSNNSSQLQKTKEMEKNVSSDPCTKKRRLSQIFPNDYASTIKSADLSTSNEHISDSRKLKTAVSKSVDNNQALNAQIAKQKKKNKGKRKIQKQKARILAASLASAQNSFPSVLKSQLSKNTENSPTKDNLKNGIQLSEESLVPRIKIAKQGIGIKNLFEPQSSLNTRISSGASAQVEDIPAQNPCSLQSKNEKIGTKGSSFKTSSFSVGASKYDILSFLGILPPKSTGMDRETIHLPESQLNDNDIQVQDPYSLQSKNEEIGIEGSSLKTSTSIGASKYKILSALGILPPKSTETVKLPDSQPCVGDIQARNPYSLPSKYKGASKYEILSNLGILPLKITETNTEVINLPESQPCASNIQAQDSYSLQLKTEDMGTKGIFQGASNYEILSHLGILPSKRTETNQLCASNIQAQDSYSLQSKTEEIGTKGSTLNGSSISIEASLKSSETENIYVPERQLYVSDGCEVTSTTEKKNKETPGSAIVALGENSGLPKLLYPFDYFSQVWPFEEIETVDEREYSRQIYAFFERDFYRLEADCMMSSQYLARLNHTMKVYEKNSPGYNDVKEKYCATIRIYHDRAAYMEIMAAQLRYIHSLLKSFDSKVKATLI